MSIKQIIALASICLSILAAEGFALRWLRDNPWPTVPAAPKAPHCELGITLHIVRGKVGYRDTAVVCQDASTGGWVVVK